MLLSLNTPLPAHLAVLSSRDMMTKLLVSIEICVCRKSQHSNQPTKNTSVNNRRRRIRMVASVQTLFYQGFTNVADTVSNSAPNCYRVSNP
jgi:hypothetical protein